MGWPGYAPKWELKRDPSDDSRSNPAMATPSGNSGAACDDGADDPRVLRALQEYVSAMEAGSPLNRAAFLAARGEIAEPLEKCLDSLALVMAAAPRLRLYARGWPLCDSRPRGPAAFGDFRIVREMGRGGMVAGLRGRTVSLGPRVALKVLPFASCA